MTSPVISFAYFTHFSNLNISGSYKRRFHSFIEFYVIHLKNQEVKIWSRWHFKEIYIYSIFAVSLKSILTKFQNFLLLKADGRRKKIHDCLIIDFIKEGNSGQIVMLFLKAGECSMWKMTGKLNTFRRNILAMKKGELIKARIYY